MRHIYHEGRDTLENYNSRQKQKKIKLLKHKLYKYTKKDTVISVK